MIGTVVIALWPGPPTLEALQLLDENLLRAAVMRGSKVGHLTVVVSALLDQAQVSVGDVDYYGGHQPLPWFRPVTQECAGLGHAKSVDTFQAMGSMSAVNIPFGLHVAEHQGRLKDGDLAVFFAGGSGVTWSSVAVRWGR